MWALWIVPLFFIWSLALIVGILAAIIWRWTRPKVERPPLFKVLAFPLGCLVGPVVLIAALIFMLVATAPTDTELYEDVFGGRPTITEDRLLFDDFDVGESRAIFMRAEPTAAERREILEIAGIRQSSLTLDAVIARGYAHSLGWWIDSNPSGIGYCKEAKVSELPGHNGWDNIMIAECVDGGTEFPQSENQKDIYVIAERRAG